MAARPKGNSKARAMRVKWARFYDFEVSYVKALQKGEGNENGQNKIQGGGGAMSKAKVEGSVDSQGMKQILLNLPAGITDLTKKAGLEPGCR